MVSVFFRPENAFKGEGNRITLGSFKERSNIYIYVYIYFIYIHIYMHIYTCTYT